MAAKTPVAVGTAGYVDPIRGCPEAPSSAAKTDVISTGYTLGTNRSRFVTRMFYFNDIDNDDTYASGLTGVKIAFWAPDEDLADASSASAVKLASDAGSIAWENAAADTLGYLLLFVDPVAAGISVAGRAM
jgi:hypothetical protein